MTRRVTWRLAQAWRLGRDLADLVRLLVRSLVWGVVAPRAEPGLAVLAGAPVVRAGEPAAYRLRAYNPAADRRSLDVTVTGWLEGTPTAHFRLDWTVMLDPGGADERWVRTDWHGEATLISSPPEEWPPWRQGEAVDRWHVEARAGDAKRASVLHVSGGVVR